MSVLGRGLGQRAVAIVAALLAAANCTGCFQGSETEPAPVRPVKTIIVTAGEGEQSRTFPGTVQASRRAELAFRVPGLLVNLPVTEGQAVAKGDLIAQLRQDEFEARLQTLQGELDQARAALRAMRAGERPEEIQRREAELRAAASRLANARSEFDRNTRLIRENAVARSVYEQSESAYEVAQEQHTAALNSLRQSTIGREEDIEANEAIVRALEGRVVEAQIQLADSTLRAPYDGVIAQRFVDQDQNIVANDRVVQFQDLQEVDIAVDVPETFMLSSFRRADIDRMTAELSAAPGVEFPVRVREIAKVADPVTQTFQIRVAMESPADLQVLPGMTASVTMIYHRADVLGRRLLIPVEAVGQTPSGQQVVWILANDGTVATRSIQLGVATGGQVEVLEGLQPGDRIVVAGVRFLREGMLVRDLGDALGAGAT